MEAMRDAWTDDRLDDLAKRMDRGFDRNDADLRELREELHTDLASVRTEQKTEMDARFGEVGSRFDSFEARFDSMQRMMIAAYLTAVLAFVATQF